MLLTSKEILWEILAFHVEYTFILCAPLNSDTSLKNAMSNVCAIYKFILLV